MLPLSGGPVDHSARQHRAPRFWTVSRIKDWRSRRVAILFGEVVVRLPRLRCPGGGRGETGTNWPAHRRSTPELDQLQAHLCALMTDRVAAGVSHPRNTSIIRKNP